MSAIGIPSVSSFHDCGMCAGISRNVQQGEHGMRQNKVWLLGAIGLSIATAAGLSAARGQGRDSAGQSNGSTGQSTQLLITHALDMAIEGSALQLTTQQACGTCTAGKSDHATSGTGVSGVNAAGATTASGGTARTTSENAENCQIQIQQHARKSFESSHELMATSNRLLRGGSEGRAAQASSSRLYAAANLYASSLFSIARETGGWEAGWKPADRSNADQGQADKAESKQDRDRSTAHVGSSESRLTAADVIAVTLINHAVKVSLNAFELNHSVRDIASTDAAAEQLRSHAKAMAVEGRQSVKEILAGLNEKGKSPSDATNDDKTPGNRAGATRAENQAGWSGSKVQALAQQAREVVRVLDELSGQAVATPERTRRSR
jgi:hypothetical protein